MDRADLPQRTSPGSIFGHAEEKAANHRGVRPSPFSLAASAPKKPQPLRCPQCASKKLFKDGLRYLNDGSTVQRWLCRNCGYRFSESNGKPFKQNKYLFKNAEQSDCEDPTVGFRGKSAAKAIALSEPTAATMAIANVGDAQNINGRMVTFLWQLAKEGVKDNTAKMYRYVLLNLASHGANLDDPETVKDVIARQPWREKTKALAVTAYTKFLEVQGKTWKKPRYRAERKLPFLPKEEELNALISAAGKRLSTYLAILKATGMRASEAWMLKFSDVDVENNVITLNDTLKHGTPRQFKVKPEVVAMIQTLPRKSDYLFHDPEKPNGLINFAKAFRQFRKRVAHKMQNPRLLKISFHTFRHWKATMEYYRTKDILYVMKLLGHKSINTTLIYTQLLNFESEQCYSAVAKTPEEACKLVEQGFRFECEVDGVKIFRKPKVF